MATAAVAVALAIAGCSHSEPTPDAGGRSSGETAEPPATTTASAETFEAAELTVVDGTLERATWALGKRVYGLFAKPATKLRGFVHAPLTGTLGTAAAPNPANPAVLAYNSFARKMPVLRIYDDGNQTDVIVDEGTYSFAWRSDGALAYFKGLEPRVADPARHIGHVFVRESPEAEPVRWTTRPGRYVVSAWAGDRLIVHERQEEWPAMIALDGPERPRVLAEHDALIALSPDGSRAFVTKQPRAAPAVAIVDIATGDEIATFSFTEEVDPLGGQPINYVADSGAWVGETVIAPVTTGVAVFDVAGDEIRLTEILSVHPDVFPLGLMEPKSDETGRWFFASAELQIEPKAAFPRTAIMECDRVRRHCVLGRTGPSFQPPRLVYNPSRPLP